MFTREVLTHKHFLALFLEITTDCLKNDHEISKKKENGCKRQHLTSSLLPPMVVPTRPHARNT